LIVVVLHFACPLWSVFSPF